VRRWKMLQMLDTAEGRESIENLIRADLHAHGVRNAIMEITETRLRSFCKQIDDFIEENSRPGDTPTRARTVAERAVRSALDDLFEAEMAPREKIN
jgi:hypothetical protein